MRKPDVTANASIYYTAVRSVNVVETSSSGLVTNAPSEPPLPPSVRILHAFSLSSFIGLLLNSPRTVELLSLLGCIVRNGTAWKCDPSASNRQSRRRTVWSLFCCYCAIALQIIHRRVSPDSLTLKTASSLFPSFGQME